ncbi:MAG: DUF4124 domain-containing protein [Halioglobus sp.]
MTRILFAILMLIPITLSAEIYKTVDKNGNVTYTDQPPTAGKSTEKVTLSPTNSAAPPPEIYRPAQPSKETEAETMSYEIAIVEPATETTIPMGGGNFSVSASVSPSLAAGQTVQLLLDGEARGDPQLAPSWALTNVFRGAHDLTVSVLDADGKSLATSDSIRVYVMRPSINNKNRN